MGVTLDDGLERAWRGNVVRARRHLGWPEDAACAVRRHASGASLALAAAIVLGPVGPAQAQIKWDMPTPYPDSNFHTRNIRQFADEIGEIQVAVGIYKHEEL